MFFTPKPRATPKLQKNVYLSPCRPQITDAARRQPGASRLDIPSPTRSRLRRPTEIPPTSSPSAAVSWIHAGIVVVAIPPLGGIRVVVVHTRLPPSRIAVPIEIPP